MKMAFDKLSRKLFFTRFDLAPARKWKHMKFWFFLGKSTTKVCNQSISWAYLRNLKNILKFNDFELHLKKHASFSRHFSIVLSLLNVKCWLVFFCIIGAFLVRDSRLGTRLVVETFRWVFYTLNTFLNNSRTTWI